ncbi:MAG: hypothetical protein U9N59_03880 [Campylobacterota bacterium]|nr:hypothetical protein [Campylobacterota bacterium]
MYDIKETSISNRGLQYILEAKQKIILTKKIKKLNIFNRTKIIEDSIYYLNGKFHQKNIVVSFQKGYFFDGKFYMENCNSKYKNKKITSKSAVYNKKSIVFKQVLLHSNKIAYKKFNLKVSL